MNPFIASPKKINSYLALLILSAAITFSGCKQTAKVDDSIKQMDSAQVKKLVTSIESIVKPELADGLTLSL